MEITQHNTSELKRYSELYDEMIDFKDYYSKMFPEWDKRLPTKCKLHDDNTPSFSYSDSLRVWSCFGQCSTSGRVVKYHMRYLKRYIGGHVSLESTLESLRNMFPYLPEYRKEFDQAAKTMDIQADEIRLHTYVDFDASDLLTSSDDSEFMIQMMMPMEKKQRNKD